MLTETEFELGGAVTEADTADPDGAVEEEVEEGEEKLAEDADA